MTWAAGIVLLLSIVGAVVIAGSDSAVPTFEEAERQGRGFFALVSLGGGIAAAGLLAGVGAILRLMVSDRLAELGPAEERDATDAPALPPISPSERNRRRSERKPARERPERKPRQPAAEKKPAKKPAKRPAEDRDEE